MTKVYTIEFVGRVTCWRWVGIWSGTHSNPQEALAQFYLDMGYAVEIESFSVEVL